MASISTPGTPHFHYWHCDTVLLVSCFDHWENLLLSLLLWAFPLPIHLTWDYQTSFLKCHFHFVNLQFKPWILSGNLWKKARSSLAFQAQSYQNSLFPVSITSRYVLRQPRPFSLPLPAHIVHTLYPSPISLRGLSCRLFSSFPYRHTSPMSLMRHLIIYTVG